MSGISLRQCIGQLLPVSFCLGCPRLYQRYNVLDCFEQNKTESKENSQLILWAKSTSMYTVETRLLLWSRPVAGHPAVHHWNKMHHWQFPDPLKTLRKDQLWEKNQFNEICLRSFQKEVVFYKITSAIVSSFFPFADIICVMDDWKQKLGPHFLGLRFSIW